MSDPPEDQNVPSLQDLCLDTVIKSITSSESYPLSELKALTVSLKCDLVIKLDQMGYGALVDHLLSLPEYLLSALSDASKRSQMFVVFQHGPIRRRGSAFIAVFVKSLDYNLKTYPVVAKLHFHEVTALASMLLDSGWPDFAEIVTSSLLACSVGTNDELTVVAARLLLLNALTVQLKLDEAGVLMEELADLKLFNEDEFDFNATQLRAIYNMECCKLYLETSAFELAHAKAMAAVSCLREEHPPRLVIDVYIVASKACIMRRQFDLAKVLVREAVLLARGKPGPESLAFAEASVALGFYAQNIGDRSEAVRAYREAEKVFAGICGGPNYNRAKIVELEAQMMLDEYTNDLESIYCLISGEAKQGSPLDDAATTGTLVQARLTCLLTRSRRGDDHNLPLAANRERMDAIYTIQRRYEEDCRQMLEDFLGQGSASNVKEFEDIDIDDVKDRLVVSLAIAEKTFGEKSLRTARHLDSLGFFYRKTLQLSLAESTLQSALAAKEAVLDADDPEVANTLRQLAVVYCLRMDFERAAPLFLRCVSIMKKMDDEIKLPADRWWLFADWLCADYRFLILCYHNTGNTSAMVEWTDSYDDWLPDHNHNHNAHFHALANAFGPHAVGPAQAFAPFVGPAFPPFFAQAFGQAFGLGPFFGPVGHLPQPALDLGADRPQSLADVVEELRRMGAFQ